MAEEKKARKDHFPDFEYRFFPIAFDETEMEGIQGPVYTPSGEIMDLGDTKTINVTEPGEVFHEGDAKTYELSNDEFDLENEIKEDNVLGYVPCPKCGAQIPVRSEKRPLKIKCPECGRKGKLE